MDYGVEQRDKFLSSEETGDGARLSLCFPTLMPPSPQARSGSISLGVVNDIIAAWYQLGAVSPNTKDVHRTRIGRGVYNSERILYIDCTGHDVWQLLKTKFPSSAAEIMPTDREKVPNAVYDHMPGNARRKGGDACLCFSCENTRLHDKARHSTGGHLKEHIANVEEDGKAASPLLVELAAVLSQSSKGEFVRACTCGGTSTALEDRAAACTDGECAKCGFDRLWSKGVRKSLFTVAGKLRRDLSPVWNENVHWSFYMKAPAPMTARAAADEDAEWELKKKVRSQTVVANKTGTLIEILDALEAVAAKHVYHRGILARQVRAADEYDRNKRPGFLDLNIDYSENATIEQARLLQLDRWTGASCTMFIGVAS